MTVRTKEGRAGAPPAWLSQGFRPFFLAASLWGAAALGIWAMQLMGGPALPSRFDPMSWHIHEMLFGFVMAAVGGFLLTAIPNWTGRLPVRGGPLALLIGLWAIGRGACLVSAWTPAPAAVAADLAFPAALGATVARELIAGRNWRNLPMLAPVVVLGVANLLMHLEALGVGRLSGLGWRLGLAAVLVLVSVVGGRITPSFTRNWLARRGEVPEGAFGRGWADRIALVSLHVGLFGWALFPTAHPAGWLLIAAAAANLWRLVRWRGGATVSEPLLLILHIGYAWLAAGAGVLGLSLVTSRVPLDAGVHVLTVGAVGTSIVAVMSRASRGHTGRPLTADAATRAVYLLIGLAALTRIAAAFAGALSPALILGAAALWIAAFALFAAAYAPMLLTSTRSKASRAT